MSDIQSLAYMMLGLWVGVISVIFFQFLFLYATRSDKVHSGICAVLGMVTLVLSSICILVGSVSVFL